MGITETRISNANFLDYNASFPGYKFEYSPTPLAAGGVGMYIDEDLNYTVIEKASENAFQALWIEIQFPKQANVICGVVYRQHNSPERFLEYFDQTLEKLSASGKSIYIMGDFNVNLLRAESYKYSHNFLLSLQSYSRVYHHDRNSAALIDNILVNNVKRTVSSGNVVSDVSDHFTQFCIFHSCKNKISPPRQKIVAFPKAYFITNYLRSSGILS